MQALAQNVAIGATVFFLAGLVLRRVPILGFFVRLVMRLALLVSPVMVIVLVVGLVWFHGSSLFRGGPGDDAPLPVNVPLPPERPGG